MAGLPRGLPEAEAAYYDNYNRGKDEFGREVLNPAGVNLTPAVAAKPGLGKYENAWIWVWQPALVDGYSRLANRSAKDERSISPLRPASPATRTGP